MPRPDRCRITRAGGSTRAAGKVPPHGRGRLGFCGSRAWLYGPGEPHNGGMFLLLNLAVGGQVGDPPDSTQFAADLMVDYVR